MNFVWEIAEAPLYADMGSWGNSWWHCFVASVGDGVLVGLIFAMGGVAFRRADWYRHPSGHTYGLMLATGLCIGLGVEWAAIHVFNRWAYTTGMPLIPGLDIGLVPVLQMLLLPPLIFHMAARWTKRK
ncbi:MAG: hypothetical protein A3K04_12165 [Gallionellales bacterium RBG_16_56_9]|nr:MAG: hypothetical protein A3K04_12165 [Gallionellales bacterium RBG_16_56_9]